MKICKSHLWLCVDEIFKCNLQEYVKRVPDKTLEMVYSNPDLLTAYEITDEPLENLLQRINAQALRMGGKYLLEKQYCPLCEVITYLGVHSDIEWVVKIAAQVKEYFNDNIVPIAKRKLPAINDADLALEQAWLAFSSGWEARMRVQTYVGLNEEQIQQVKGMIRIALETGSLT